jgi:hypothetical protein
VVPPSRPTLADGSGSGSTDDPPLPQLRETAATLRSALAHNQQLLAARVDRGQRQLCAVCLDAEAVVAMVPCGHVCLCEPHAAVLQAHCKGGHCQKCPMCQGESSGTLKIFAGWG